MPVAEPVQVAAVELAYAAVFSAAALLPRAGPVRPKIPGRAPRRFSVGFAEWAGLFVAVEAQVAEVDAVVAIVSSIPRRYAKPAVRYR